MYIILVILLMFVLPVGSIFIEFYAFKNATEFVLLMGKWFAFWSVGVRLTTAGLRQILNPRFTAERIFGLTGEGPYVIVQELGFANLSIGVLGMLAILGSGWLLPAAVTGGIFLGSAGFRHLARKSRNRLETTAMVSNLFVLVVLLVFVLSGLWRH